MSPFNRSNRFGMMRAAIVMAGVSFATAGRAQQPDAAVSNPALGIEWRTTTAGQFAIDVINPQGPGAKAGLAKGDILIALNGDEVKSSEALSAGLKKTTPGQRLVMQVLRGGESLTKTIVMPAARVNMFGAYLEVTKGQIAISEVTPNTPAERAGLMKGDLVVTMAGQRPSKVADLTSFMSKLVANDKATEPILVTVQRAEKEDPLTLTIERVPAPAANVPAPPPSQDVALATARPVVLGVTIREQGNRVIVVRTYEREPAALAGIVVDDVIISVNKKPISSHATLMTAIAPIQPGDDVAVEVQRAEKTGVLSVKAVNGGPTSNDVVLEKPAPDVTSPPATLADEVRVLRARVDALEQLVGQLVKQLGGATSKQ